MPEDILLPDVSVSANPKTEEQPPVAPVGYSYDPRSVDTARGQGYSDSEILDHVATELGVDISGAREGGYSDREILSHLTGATTPPEGTITKTTSPLEAAGMGATAATGAQLVKESAKIVKPLGKGVAKVAETVKSATPQAPNLGAMADRPSLQNYLNSQVRHGLSKGEMRYLPLEELEKLAGKNIFTLGEVQDALKDVRAQKIDLTKYLAQPPQPKTVAQMANELKTGAPEFFKKTLPKATGDLTGMALKKLMPVASSAAAAADIQDIMNRVEHGDYGRAAVSGLGLLGSGLSFAPHPVLKGVGLTLGAGAPVVNEVIDRVYGREGYKTGGLVSLKEGGKTPAWQRKEGKNPEGGLNAAGRASYNRETGGHLKRPQPEGGKRRDSFCARMKGMKKKLTSAETANDPDSRINKSLRAWNC